MTEVIYVSLCVVLLVNKFQYWLAKSKIQLTLLKLSLWYKINYHVMKNLVLYGKEKRIHHKLFPFSPSICMYICVS